MLKRLKSISKATGPESRPDGDLLGNWFTSNTHFHLLYSSDIQRLSAKHWTPLPVAKIAAEFLVMDGDVRILDIGSGVGTFCLSASHYKPNAIFDGVEQRSSLITHAESARNMLGLFNVHFIHGNFTQVNFKRYHHFYFYNSFFENLDNTAKIDDSIHYSPALYNYYSAYLCKELEKMPTGTRIVTYCSWGDEIPASYKIYQNELDGLLKLYIKG